MGVYLEKYSKLIPKTLKQAYEVHGLVNWQKDYLNTDPDRRFTVNRYKTLGSSIMSLLRTARNPEIDAYIIRQKKHSVAIGLATVIFNQTIVHPELDEPITGNNLDLWLYKNASDHLHRHAAEALVQTQLKITKEPYELDTKTEFNRRFLVDVISSPNLFVVSQQDSKIIPNGLIKPIELGVNPDLALSALGSPSHLSRPNGEADKYGIAASDRLSQIYFRRSVYDSGRI